MEKNLKLLHELIKENKLSEVYSLLDVIVSEEEDFDEYRTIQNAIIEASFSSKNYAFLDLLNHPYCHGDLSDNMKQGKNTLARFVMKNKHYDLIEPLILKSLTTMEHITLYALSDYNTREHNLESIHYLFNHPRLAADYGILRNCYVNLFKKLSFDDEANIDYIKTFQNNIYHVPELINECINNSIKGQTQGVTEYLLAQYPKQTKKMMIDWVNYMETGKSVNFNYSFSIFNNLQINPNSKTNLDDFLLNLYKTLNDNVVIHNQEKILVQFLEPFLYNGDSDYFNNSFAKGFEFLTQVYALSKQNVPLSIMELIKKNKYFSFNDFNIYYDKLILEQTVNHNLDLNQNKKMKL